MSALFNILFIIFIGAVPVWLTTRRMRRKFQSRFGRKPAENELTSIAAWMKEPPTEQPSPFHQKAPNK